MPYEVKLVWLSLLQYSWRIWAYHWECTLFTERHISQNDTWADRLLSV
jgi:hypothetical protein